MKTRRKKYHDRLYLIEELSCRYGGWSGLRKFHFLRRRYLWMLVVGGSKCVKRSMDIIVSVVVLLLLLPLLVFVAVLIKLTDGGPVFFSQTRIGKWGREFSVYKFRSMVCQADKQVEDVVAMSHHLDSISYKIKNDPRITWVGQLIRKSSIDELPQLVNVLKGEMSLVGPRPHVFREVVQYTLADRRRLDVTPGITCIWQISGRADIPFAEQLQLDVNYIDSQSFLTDIKILLKTVPAVLSAKGAY